MCYFGLLLTVMKEKITCSLALHLFFFFQKNQKNQKHNVFFIGLHNKEKIVLKHLNACHHVATEKDFRGNAVVFMN